MRSDFKDKYLDIESSAPTEDYFIKISSQLKYNKKIWMAIGFISILGLPIGLFGGAVNLARAHVEHVPNIVPILLFMWAIISFHFLKKLDRWSEECKLLNVISDDEVIELSQLLDKTENKQIRRYANDVKNMKREYRKLELNALSAYEREQLNKKNVEASRKRLYD